MKNIKGGIVMILFTILATILTILVVATVLIISVFGAVGIIIFGDVIVCIVLIVLLMKWLISRKKK